MAHIDLMHVYRHAEYISYTHIYMYVYIYTLLWRETAYMYICIRPCMHRTCTANVVTYIYY